MEDLLYDFFSLIADPALMADMYRKSMHTPLFIINAFLTVLVGAIFYKILDHPKYRKFRHWFYFLMINFGIAVLFYLLALLTLKGRKTPVGTAGGGNLFDFPISVFLGFSLEMAVLFTLWFFLCSMMLKPFSNNCNNTPF